MPKRAKEIEQVGKSTMVDLRAQLYRSEESLKHTESGASAAATLAAERRKVERRRDVLGAGRNAGVGERFASDVKAERDAATLSHEAMARKVRAYEAMARGECEEGRESLIDFELKQLRGDPLEPAEPPTLVSADMAREAERKQWEAAAAAATSSGGEGGGGRSASEKRLHHELSEETEQGRSSALDQKLKRQRALEERRAMIRMRSESRRREQEGASPNRIPNRIPNRDRTLTVTVTVTVTLTGASRRGLRHEMREIRREMREVRREIGREIRREMRREIGLEI